MRDKIKNIKKTKRRFFTILMAVFFAFSFGLGSVVKATEATELPTILKGTTVVKENSTNKTVYGGFSGNETVFNPDGSYQEGAGQTILGGDGTFSSKQDYGAGTLPWSETMGDFNGDGKIDLVTAGFMTGNVTYLKGNGNGSFIASGTFATGLSPYTITSGDFNNDNKRDLAVGCLAGRGVSILIGNGDGTFKPKADYYTGETPQSVITGDFNKDGNLDLAVIDTTNENVAILLGKGNGTFNGAYYYTVGVVPRIVTSGDFNKDGYLDLAIANQDSHNVSILIGNGDGTFRSKVDYPIGVSVYNVAIGDFNADGNTDLVTLNGTARTYSILLGSEQGVFTLKGSYSLGAISTSYIASGDFNADGKTDLAITDSSGNAVYILLGVGDGSFTANGSFGTGTFPRPIVAGDFNQDGKIDLAVANASSNNISILLGKGVPSGTTGTGYDLFGFLKGNLDNCLRGIVLTQNSSNCYVSNTYSGNMRVMTSRTYVGGKDDPLLEIAALAQKNAALVVGDVSLGGMDPNDFAYWGRNLAQGSGASSSTDSFWGLNNYTNTQSFSTDKFKQYAAKITALEGEGAPLANGSLTGAIYLQSDSIGTAPASGVQDKYPNGKVWYYGRNLAVSSPIQFSGKGTIIVDGNLTIDANQNIKPADADSTLGIIVLGNVIFSGDNTVDAAIFAAGSTLTGGDMRFNGDDVNLIGSFVAASFTGIPGRSNISFYYDKNLGSNWPPGFGDLNMPQPTEN